ncbi:MAG: type VI secretion system contractile sheath small subunit, partial [Chthoniobacterales bacterium]|nr:type VI secretion system contractile sheath small subunit [Chthoniobacterales bacterium]
FDERLKAAKPRIAIQVPNTLTGEGNLSVELTFESMEDFSPAAVARKVEALNKLLTARQQLANLLTYMDGKSGAEELLAKILQDPALLQSLAAQAKKSEQVAVSETETSK